MTRHVEIDIVNRHCAHVRGHGSREAIATVTNGKAPVWSTISKAWVCSERTARERLLPHLEHLGYSVVVTGPRMVSAAKVPAAPAVERPDPDPELW